MKRCPECEFLYENETIKCEMDGTPLRYTVALPSLPGLAKSIWDKWTIALLCAVVLGTVLVILYRATPRAYTSSSAGQMKSANDEMPSAEPNAQPSESPAPSELSVPEQAADASEVSDLARDPFESQSTMTETKAQKSMRSSPLADEKAPSPAAVIHFEPVSNPPAPATSSTATKPAITEATAGEKSATQTSSQTVSSSATSPSAHPKPPETYANKAATPNQKKDSGLKSFFKKAGKVLKKPFGD